tara:strand:- start:175 stop:537 length:363 start_codon:yes stop_codon:yes gene_type:complete
MIQSAHDCSEGGLSVSLSESCFGTDGGANIDISPLLSNNPDLSIASVLFGESLGRILVSVTNRDAHNFEVAMRGVACLRLGNVIEDDQLLIKNVDTTILDSSVSRLKKIWQSTLDGSEKR